MEITNKLLSERGVQLLIDNPDATVESVYVANANRLYDSCGCGCFKILDVSYPVDFDQETYRIYAHVPAGASTLIFITLKYHTPEDASNQYITVPFVNEFSVLKAKTKYLELYYCCDGGCGSHDNCLGKCCGASCCTGNNCPAGSCQRGHCGGCTCSLNPPTCEATYGGYCGGCGDKNRLLELLVFMLRMNVFMQLYKSNHTQGMLDAYRDLCRVKNMDVIPFTYMNLSSSYYKNPGKLQELFIKVNDEFKYNTNACVAKAVKLLMMQGLYDIIFQKADETNAESSEWILEDSVWNMEDEFWFNNKSWNY